MRVLSLATIALAFSSSAALTQQPAASQTRPQALTRLLDCRGQTASEARLACYDQAVAALAEAEAKRDLIVMDRQQVRRTRRSLFGFVLPDLDLFGDGKDDPEGFTELEAGIRGVSRNANGKWIFLLDDGARWIQSDSRELGREPRRGQKIKIRRAAMGSYLANVDGQIAIRVRREQ